MINAENKKKKRNLKIILWSLLPVFIFMTFLAGDSESNPYLLIFPALAFLVDVGIIYYMARKFYNWPVMLILAFSAGIIFKRYHWPLSGVIITISVVLVAVSSLVNSVRFQFTFRHDSFLRWFGALSCFVAALFLSGFLFRFQHWSDLLGNILGYSGSLLFLISVLAMVFTLPNSNYINWTVLDRKIFYRAIVIPMIFLFVFMTIVYVFDDAFRVIMEADYTSTPWQTGNIDLFDLEGISGP
ncbi:MAG TPA: hypothetical protein VMV47_12120 [Bacteroidales bacterium]|nr:hypothetical protein [Bacteroidales bacterium]